MTELLRTPLYDLHVRLGARMVPFAGWEMPVQYSGVVAEHKNVRNAAGLFDLSHMGEFEITGAQAEEFLNHTLTNNVSRLAVGQAQYTLIPYTDGTIADDAILYRLEDRYLLVVNASCREKDLEWMEHEKLGYPAAVLRDASSETALVAVQGPNSERIVSQVTEEDVAGLRYYHAMATEVCGVSALVARTGYTGEDGFEIFLDPSSAEAIWNCLQDAGSGFGLLPAGLGARDTLRLEASMALYGHEISEQTNPIEAGLGWAVKLDKGDFVGREALEREKKLGPARKLVGFELVDRGVPRADQPIAKNGEQVGFVTSGTHSPTLNKPIGMGYVPTRYSKPGTEIEILIRERLVRAVVVAMPFYKRQKGENS